jgi:hypothetical protein
MTSVESVTTSGLGSRGEGDHFRFEITGGGGRENHFRSGIPGGGWVTFTSGLGGGGATTGFGEGNGWRGREEGGHPIKDEKIKSNPRHEIHVTLRHKMRQKWD